MSILRTDTFSAGAGPLDSTWTQQHDTGTANYDGSGNAVAGTADVWVSAFDNSNVYPDDQYSKVTLAGACFAGFDFVGVTTRMSGTGTNSRQGYALVTDFTSGAGHTDLIRWTTPNVSTTIGSFAATFAVGDVLELRSVGSEHEAIKNGSSLGTITDATIASGSAGVIFGDNSGGGSTPLIEDWEGGDIEGAPPIIRSRKLATQQRMTQ